MRKPIKQTVSQILQVVCEVYEVDRSQITGRDRTAEAIEPRLAAYLLSIKELPRVSHQTIGNLIGNRGRSTITHGIKAARDRIETEPKFAKSVNRCMRMLETN